MTKPTTPDRVIDHNNECVGCGMHLSEPCNSFCEFETGEFGPAVLLRAAAGRLRQHPAGFGYNVSAALFAVALDLVGSSAAVQTTEEAKAALADYLLEQWGANVKLVRGQPTHRHGPLVPLPEIARSLYAAAARHSGIDFDPDAFGEFPI